LAGGKRSGRQRARRAASAVSRQRWEALLIILHLLRFASSSYKKIL
jgi:hypothetical protein